MKGKVYKNPDCDAYGVALGAERAGRGGRWREALPEMCMAAGAALLFVAGFLLGLEARGAEVTKDTLFGDVDGAKTTVGEAVAVYADAAIAAAIEGIVVTTNGDGTASTVDLTPLEKRIDAATNELAKVSGELDGKARRYALVASATAAIKGADGNLYALAAGTNGVDVTLPAALADYAQDFVLRVVAADTNGTQIGEISGMDIDLPNGDVFADGSLKGTNYVTFTQTASNTWSIGYFAASKEK